jgi:hypothetical protein
VFDWILKAFLLPLAIAAALWLAKDDMEQRAAVAVANAGRSSAEAAAKRAQDAEQRAANLAQQACARQAVISLQAGRTIEGIVRAPSPASGRGMVGAADLARVIGQ